MRIVDPSSQDILNLIAKGESKTLEFKKSFGKETIETICAFANSYGGTVLIGVTDTGSICGTLVGAETIPQITNSIKNSTEKLF